MPKLTICLDKEIFNQLDNEYKKTKTSPEEQVVNLIKNHFSKNSTQHRQQINFSEIKDRVRKSQDVSVLKEYFPHVFHSDGSEGQKERKLKKLLERIPCVQGSVVGNNEGGWYIKMSLDLDAKIVWNVIQELSFVLNNLSMTEKLSVVFKPVSPPPYLHGGPDLFLSWVIEPVSRDVDPELIADALVQYLPKPINEEQAWTR